MGGFRGSDEVLEREIAALEGVGRTRVKRYARDLDEIARELAQLKRERARRRADAAVALESGVSAEASRVGADR